MKLSDIKKNPSNPRVIRDAKFHLLKKSIEDFPAMMELRPIVVDETGMILGGNMRYEGIKALGLKEIPDAWVKRADELTEEQKREFIIKDNVGFGEWDWDGLANSWSDLPLSDWALDLPEDWLAPPKVEEDEAAVVEMVDRAAELQEKWQVKPGDLFIIGTHRLLCGDSTNPDDVRRLMDGKRAVLCHADPPYGMGKEGEGVANDNLYASKLDAFQMKWWRACRPHMEDNASAYIFGNAEDLWRLWFVGGLKDSERLTFRNQIIWNKPFSGMGDGQNNSVMRSYGIKYETCLFFMLGEQGFNNNADNYWEGWDSIVAYLENSRQQMGWNIKDTKRIAGHSEKSGCHWFDKSQWSMPTREVYEAWQQAARGDAFKRDYDAFKRDYDDLKRDYDDLKRDFYATRAYFDNTHDNMTDVWDFPRVTGDERHDHPTPKPVPMIERAIKSSAPAGAIVYSPFCGSGTDIAAGERSGRAVYTMDSEPVWCAVTLERMSALGLKPELLETVT